MEILYLLIMATIVAIVAIIIAKDAESRGMSWIRWGVFTFLIWILAIPIYLIVRKPRNESSMACRPIIVDESLTNTSNRGSIVGKIISVPLLCMGGFLFMMAPLAGLISRSHGENWEHNVMPLVFFMTIIGMVLVTAGLCLWNPFQWRLIRVWSAIFTGCGSMLLLFSMSVISVTWLIHLPGWYLPPEGVNISALRNIILWGVIPGVIFWAIGIFLIIKQKRREREVRR
jgi:hypothetical protein